jgi:plasmid replication initiation protein
MTKQSNKIARIENKFIFNAQYKLTAREQKVVLYLISNIDPRRQERFHEQIISVKELESVLKADGKKWGGLYEEMQGFTDRVLDKKIRFATDLEIDGKRFPGKINFFQSVIPVHNEKGEVALRFLFSEDLKPFLLQLNEYAQINRLEAAPMKSGHAIRMYQIFKAQRDRMRKYEKISKIVYDVETLKGVLGIAGKYKRFNSFRERVLDTITGEINTYTSINLLDIEYVRNASRLVTDLIFVITDKAPHEKPGHIPSQGPTEEELQKTFTKSQIRAYRLLIKRQILPGIAFKQVVPKITTLSSEFIGFEDWYVSIAWGIFEDKTNISGNQAETIKAGAFINWLLRDNIFNQGDMFALIQERMAEKKKRVEQENPSHWEDRLTVKGIPASEAP